MTLSNVDHEHQVCSFPEFKCINVTLNITIRNFELLKAQNLVSLDHFIAVGYFEFLYPCHSQIPNK